MPDKRFQRRIEDFTCEHCGVHVVGDGFTNHCPKCLWSKHVDVNPGDRTEQCGGMMEPIRLEGSTPHYRIVHRCTRCGAERIVGVGKNDEGQMIIQLASSR